MWINDSTIEIIIRANNTEAVYKLQTGQILLSSYCNKKAHFISLFLQRWTYLRAETPPNATFTLENVYRDFITLMRNNRY